MSKSVIVIDTPKTCFDCQGYVCIDDVNYCIYTRNIRYIPNKPTWCPLKQLPEYKKEKTIRKPGVSLTARIALTDFEKGWNECLNEVVGSDKDDNT